MDGETRRYIRSEIARQMGVILFGAAGANQSDRETIDNLYPGQPSITDRPVMHPYGHVSRAPSGTISVCAKTGEHVGNRSIIGHMDRNRPSVESGEVQLYNATGQAIYLQNGSVRVGSAASANPVVLGNEIKEMLQTLITLLAEHKHISSSPGAPTTAPITASDISSVQSDYVDNDLILSQLVFTQKEAG